MFIHLGGDGRREFGAAGAVCGLFPANQMCCFASLSPKTSPVGFPPSFSDHTQAGKEGSNFPGTWPALGSLKHMPACSPALCFLHPPPPHAEYIQKYATEEALKEQEEGTGDSSSESSMSDFSEDEAQDMEL